ncbi:hypothetical protein [Streptomyces sp. SAJ15]|uniref:hypothetical protein n=1 Tax=Streptomyces sp. SAJ15 TaxID=2011095 RepID=UPI001186BEC6|nr:hypothetical protein [Streptomyces sp. SAJ15]TVL89798.1 hypothetical protein CD790_25720 [Streptomyces sp. SAJ15]
MYALQIVLVVAVYAALAAVAWTSLTTDRCARHIMASRIAAGNCTRCQAAGDAGQPMGGPAET